MNILPTQPCRGVLKNAVGLALFISFFVCLNFNLQAQDSFAKIEKNVNILAKNLIHEQNVTKDSLVLQSDKKIKALYTINEDDPSSELGLFNNKDSYMLPLNSLS